VTWRTDGLATELSVGYLRSRVVISDNRAGDPDLDRQLVQSLSDRAPPAGGGVGTVRGRGLRPGSGNDKAEQALAISPRPAERGFAEAALLLVHTKDRTGSGTYQA